MRPLGPEISSQRGFYLLTQLFVGVATSLSRLSLSSGGSWVICISENCHSSCLGHGHAMVPLLCACLCL